MNARRLLCLSLGLLLGSCAQSSLTGDTYSQDEVGRAHGVRLGYIKLIEPVKIEGGTDTGAVLGALAGGFLGSNIGSGRAANTAGAVGGALVGSAVGSHAEQSMNSRQGLRITVELDYGKGRLQVVQEASSREIFRVGDRVSVQGSGSRDRVVHSNAPPPKARTSSSSSGRSSSAPKKSSGSGSVGSSSKPASSGAPPASNSGGEIDY